MEWPWQTNPAGQKFLPPQSLLTWSTLFTLLQLRGVSKGPQRHSASWPPPSACLPKTHQGARWSASRRRETEFGPRPQRHREVGDKGRDTAGRPRCATRACGTESGGEKPRVQLGHRERYPWAVLDRVRPVARGSIYPAGDTLPETLLNVFHLTPGCLDRSE